jgi:hypothetical protein
MKSFGPTAMHRFIRSIASRCPAWATATETDDGLDVDATVIRASGRPMPAIHLRVWVQGRLRVKQRDPVRWPEGCPERHIEWGGTFCLGKGAPLAPDTDEDADTWWHWLREFISAQFFADRNGYWPTRFLHHGDAADVQVAMENLVADTILEADVRQALDERRGWLAEESPRLTRDRTALVNLRSPCPRGCSKRKAPLPKGADRKAYPILRRRCKQRELLLSVVKLEMKRRAKEEEYWAQHPRKECCGTMKACPLG